MGSGTIEQGSSTGSSTPRLTTPTFARTHSQSVSGVPWSPASTNHPSILDIYQADCGGSSATAGSLPPSPSFDSITHHPQPIRQRHYNFKSEFEVYPGESEKDSIYHTHQPIIPPRPASCPPCMAEYLDGKNVIQDDDDGQKVFLGNVSGGSLLRKVSPSLRFDQSLFHPKLRCHRPSQSHLRNSSFSQPFHATAATCLAPRSHFTPSLAPNARYPSTHQAQRWYHHRQSGLHGSLWWSNW